MSEHVTPLNANAESQHRRADAAPLPEHAAQDSERRGFSPPVANDYRDARGRFAKGNPGGPGNPYARETATIKKMIHEEADVECLREILRGIIAEAKKGDLAAAKFVFSYAYGKPTAPPDPDRLDLHEWQIYKECADNARDFKRVCETPDSAAMLKAARIGRFAFGIQFEDDMRDAWQHANREDEKKQRRNEKRKQRQAAKAPSPNGDFRGSPPIANGNLSVVPPSANGNNGDPPVPRSDWAELADLEAGLFHLQQRKR